MGFTLINDLKDHKRLCMLKLSVDDQDGFGPNFSYLREYLSHNRRISLTNEDGKIYSDGNFVDALYKLNRFCRGSAGLLGASLERPSLVASALVTVASKDFQRISLLLSDHTDALHGFVQCAQLEDGVSDRDDDSSAQSNRGQNGDE